MFGNKEIGKRVMAVIKQRIADAQKAFDDACERLDGDHQDKVSEMEQKLASDKADLAETHVQSILGKVL